MDIFLKKEPEDTKQPIKSKVTTQKDRTPVTEDKKPVTIEEKPKPKLSSEKEGSLSDSYFMILFWSLILTRLWMNMWILQLLLPIVVIMWLLKFLGNSSSIMVKSVLLFLLCLKRILNMSLIINKNNLT